MTQSPRESEWHHGPGRERRSASGSTPTCFAGTGSPSRPPPGWLCAHPLGGLWQSLLSASATMSPSPSLLIRGAVTAIRPHLRCPGGCWHPPVLGRGTEAIYQTAGVWVEESSPTGHEGAGIQTIRLSPHVQCPTEGREFPRPFITYPSCPSSPHSLKVGLS